MTKELFVKCPECGKENNFGEKAARVYESSLAFMINKTCEHCGMLFIESDTSESDYSFKEKP